MSVELAEPVPKGDFANRWKILAIAGLAQFMVVLDATIVNIALPSAQTSLGFSDESRQWVITAYALAFGSLLLLGGRLGDRFGRKQVFVTGLLGFAGASALGGAAGSFELLVAARALQGIFAALLAPAALAILAVTFTDPAERGKAFGIYGALAGIGAGVGLLLGGVLTEWLSWRWCLYVNLAFVLPAAAGALAWVQTAHRSSTGHERPSIDLPGAAASSGGLFALVFGLASGETNGWGELTTIISLIAALVLLVAFVAIELRVTSPLLPMRVVLDPTRGGSYFATAVLGVAIFGVLLFLTFYLQQNLGYSPIKAGLAFMAMNVTILFVSGVTGEALLPRFGPRPLVVTGLLLVTAAMIVFAQITPSTGYVDRVMPGMILMGIGAGLLYITAFTLATYGVDAQDTGVASAVLNASQQVGGSVGTALLSTVFANALAGSAASNPAAAAVDGYVAVFWWAAAITFLGALICGAMITTKKSDLPTEIPVGAGAH